jgi:hypothetical protein
MNSTHDSAFAMLQGGVMVSSHLSAPQLLSVLAQDSGKFNGIAWFIVMPVQKRHFIFYKRT